MVLGTLRYDSYRNIGDRKKFSAHRVDQLTEALTEDWLVWKRKGLRCTHGEVAEVLRAFRWSDGEELLPNHMHGIQLGIETWIRHGAPAFEATCAK